MHDPLAELPTTPRVPIAEPLRRARTAIRTAVADMVAVPDAALERPWRWHPDDPDDLDVRYGLYRLHERLEDAAAEVARRREAAGSSGGSAGAGAGPAVALLAASGTARWELYGALAGIPDEAWDADPGGGEWTIRRTVAHVISSQRAYGWTTAWFLHRAGEPDAGEYAPDGALPPEPDEATEADGAVGDVIDRLDGLVDQAIEVLAGLDAAGLAVPGRWSGIPITVGFRLNRLGSHLREHTIQVDKTVAMLGRPIQEVDRIARLVLGSYGRLEALVVGRASGSADASG
ncbi:MAG TPA: DinB family protein, partial [Candidatus Limnocylindrales bacterium]|nr:DinB family protein [Candidatus Limnocylindrales bacterium]